MNTLLTVVAIGVPALVSFLVTRMSLDNQRQLLAQTLKHQQELHQNDLDNERQRTEEARLEEWKERGRETVADLLMLLVGGLQKNSVFTPAGKEPLDRFENDLRRRIVMLWKFAPTKEIREAADKPSRWTEKLLKDGRVLNYWGSDYPHKETRLKVLDRYERELGESMYALDVLTAVLAGDELPDRAAYAPLLADDGQKSGRKSADLVNEDWPENTPDQDSH